MVEVRAAVRLEGHPDLKTQRYEPEQQVQNQIEAHGELVGDVQVGVAPELEEPLLVQRRGHDVRKLEDAVACTRAVTRVFFQCGFEWPTQEGVAVWRCRVWETGRRVNPLWAQQPVKAAPTSMPGRATPPPAMSRLKRWLGWQSAIANSPLWHLNVRSWDHMIFALESTKRKAKNFALVRA